MLSICIPAYIHASFTLEAVRNILTSKEDFELVLVDDFYRLSPGSKERVSADELEAIISSDPRCKSISNDSQRPIYENWNFTVSHANRSYIKLMGADDRLHKDDISRILEIIKTNPDPLIHGHLVRIINENGREIRRQRPYTDASIAPLKLKGNDAIKFKLAQVARLKEPICNVFKKTAWSTVGGYPTNCRFRSDVTFNVRVMNLGEAYFWNEYLGDLRRHPGSDARQLPADLAAHELSDLITEIYEILGSDLTEKDVINGEGWHLYRLIELCLQRYCWQPIAAASFIARNKRDVEIRPKHVLKAFETFTRRVLTGDVQRTLKT